MSDIRKILVANRGEIAVRIIRTCRDLGIDTVAVYSDADRTAPHVPAAGESVLIGEAPPAKSYLATENIIAAALATGADAIHPGYGFLSENAGFAEACLEKGLIFIGPSAESIARMGDKTSAREIMKRAGVPLPPGTTTAITGTEEALDAAREIGYPVLVKAAAGGGGKGMRIVHSEKDLNNSIKAAMSEAQSAFGDGRVYIEKYFESPRHVEFQIISDFHGNTLHLFDRECSIQRRHQKIVEEAPCAVLSEPLREEMARAAIKAAESCGYSNAGTVEFLLDENQNFYFLEMNTRLQVEHPVTELITGIDLVALQIDVASGRPLQLRQEDIKRRGHALECRISAEDPEDNFMPDTGTLKTHRVPSGPWVRVDEGVAEGQEISIYYDPLMAKVITWGSDRLEAIRRMDRALAGYQISGVKTTLPFCRFVMNHENFINADYNTHFIENHYDPETPAQFPDETADEVAALSAALLMQGYNNNHAPASSAGQPASERDSGSWWLKRNRINRL